MSGPGRHHMNTSPVYVTRPVLPALADVMPLLEEIWSSRMLSNYGPLLQRFECALAAYLGVEHLAVVCNASLGLVMALRLYGITGEVITSPFSFLATSHAIRWAGAEPVFADIDPVTLNLDPDAVEASITARTQAIMPVHCYGVPCDTARLGDIAKRHGLRLIYDAAHSFGVRKGNRPLVAAGDLSVLSFHATKVFNTFEGGAIIAPDHETKLALQRLGNYGIEDEVTFGQIGLNTKMSELHAAMGLALLPHIDDAIAARAVRARYYARGLEGVRGIMCQCPPRRNGHNDGHNDGHNSYAFPIRVGDDYPISRDALHARLAQEGIVARRYFYPSISEMPMYRHLPSASRSNLRVALKASDQILCLPLYPDLDMADQDRILRILAAPCA